VSLAASSAVRLVLAVVAHGIYLGFVHPWRACPAAEQTPCQMQALLCCRAGLEKPMGALALVSCGCQSQATEGRGVGEISLQCSLQLPAVVLQRLLRRPLAAQARARAEPPPTSRQPRRSCVVRQSAW
jgi:hypothetical protein